MKTQTGSISSSVGFRRTSGEIRKAVTRTHSMQDVGQTFIDNFGRTYVYTKQGLIY
jgi:hypothetical protein